MLGWHVHHSFPWPFPMLLWSLGHCCRWCQAVPLVRHYLPQMQFKPWLYASFTICANFALQEKLLLYSSSVRLTPAGFVWFQKL